MQLRPLAVAAGVVLVVVGAVVVVVVVPLSEKNKHEIKIRHAIPRRLIVLY